MREQRFPKYIVYAALSLASPIIAFLAIYVYVSVANSAFWSSLGPEDSAAAAMGAFAEMGQVLLFTMIGCFVGMIFAIISLRVQRRIFGFGQVGIVFNGLPLLLLMFYMLKG